STVCRPPSAVRDSSASARARTRRPALVDGARRRPLSYGPGAGAPIDRGVATRMAEIEIHHEHPESADPVAKRVGLMVGTIGVALAVVTTASHREHTHAVLTRTEANDLWAYYQAKKIREHTSDVGGQLLQALGTDATRTAAAAAKFEAARAKYTADAE